MSGLESESMTLTITVSATVLRSLAALCDAEDRGQRITPIDEAAIIEALVEGLRSDLGDIARGVQAIEGGYGDRNAGLEVLQAVAGVQEARAQCTRALLETNKARVKGYDRDSPSVGYWTARSLAGRLLNSADIEALRPDPA